jgi:hypothetical protein
MTTYCSTATLIAHTGTRQDETTVLTPILEAADRDVDAYLAPYGVSGSGSDDNCKQAALKFAMAYLIERGVHKGEYQASSGGFASSLDYVRVVRNNRDEARRCLDTYLDSQTSLPSKKIGSIVRVVKGR